MITLIEKIRELKIKVDKYGADRKNDNEILMEVDDFLAMAQALITVDDVLKEVEKLDNLMPSETLKYHTNIVRQIRKTIESPEDTK